MGQPAGVPVLSTEWPTLVSLLTPHVVLNMSHISMTRAEREPGGVATLTLHTGVDWPYSNPSPGTWGRGTQSNSALLLCQLLGGPATWDGSDTN